MLLESTDTKMNKFVLLKPLCSLEQKQQTSNCLQAGISNSNVI